MAWFEALRRAGIGPTRPPVRRVDHPVRRAHVRCAAECWPLLWASHDAGGPPPLRWRRWHLFPRPTRLLPRQRGFICPRARSRLWSRLVCSVSMRRRARRRPEGQGIARTCLEIFLCTLYRRSPKLPAQQLLEAESEYFRNSIYEVCCAAWSCAGVAASSMAAVDVALSESFPLGEEAAVLNGVHLIVHLAFVEDVAAIPKWSWVLSSQGARQLRACFARRRLRRDQLTKALPGCNTILVCSQGVGAM